MPGHHVRDAYASRGELVVAVKDRKLRYGLIAAALDQF